MSFFDQTLFLKINNTVGKNKLRDMFFYFCGQYLIWILVLLNVYFFFALDHEFLTLVFISIPFIVAYLLSYTIAYVFRHPRPIVEFPQIKELIIPLGTWKSFPSDHTIGAMLLVFAGYVLSFGSPLVLWFGIPIAVCVMAGRIYCGVHYPRDIIGGIIVTCAALVISYMCFVSFMILFGGMFVTSF